MQKRTTTNPVVDEKASEAAQLMTRILLGAAEDLPLFTIKIWVSQLVRVSTDLETLLEHMSSIDLFTQSVDIDQRLSDEDADWFAIGLEAHGRIQAVPDALKEA